MIMLTCFIQCMLFIRSFSHSVIQSFSHSVIQSFSHSVIQSFSHSVIHSVIQSFSHSVIQSFSHSVIQSFSHSVSKSFILYLPPSTSRTNCCTRRAGHASGPPRREQLRASCCARDTDTSEAAKSRDCRECARAERRGFRWARNSTEGEGEEEEEEEEKEEEEGGEEERPAGKSRSSKTSFISKVSLQLRYGMRSAGLACLLLTAGGIEAGHSFFSLTWP
jgi:hypothetical protein